MSVFRGTGCTYGAGAQVFGLKLRAGLVDRVLLARNGFSPPGLGEAVRKAPRLLGDSSAGDSSAGGSAYGRLPRLDLA